MVRIALPWATTDMRAQVAAHAWATDATPTSGGAASAFVPPALRPIFLKECELKGVCRPPPHPSRTNYELPL